MASQICPLCHQEAPSTARYCPNCASPLRPDVPPLSTTSPAVSGRTPTRLDVAAWRSQRVLIVVLACAVVLLFVMAAFFWHQTSVMEAEHLNLPAAPPIVGAQPSSVPGAPSVVGAQKTPLPPGPSVVGAQTKPGMSVPPEVTDYLNFLSQIEQQRVALKNNLNAGLVMLGAAKSMEGAESSDQQQGANSQINSGYGNYTQQWQDLVGQFQAKPAPPECTALANSYYALLADYSKYISQIQVAMQNKDLNTLMNLQGSAQGQVNTDAQNADNALVDLCQKYGIQKPFNIQSDAAGSGTSLFGP